MVATKDRVAIYSRQSITRAGSDGLPDQVRQCREAAERLGLAVVAEVVEDPSTSGFKERGRTRAGLLELLRTIDA